MKVKNEVSFTEIKESYDRDYKDRKFGGPDFTHKWILKILRPHEGRRILDIGCGQGLLLKEAEKAGLIAHGIDISSEAVKMARENAPSSEIVCGDAHRLIWKENHFDYITNIGSLEHFLEPEACIKEMCRVMKSDGKACIMLPNLYYYRNIVNRFLWDKGPASYQPVERFASLRGWSRLMEQNGFKIDRVYKYNKFNRPRLLIFIRTILIPLHLSHHFVFVCSKRQV